MNKKRYDIYVGCDNISIYDEKNALEYVKEELSELFIENQIGFSITTQLGGYLHEDGTYIIEDSLKITLISELKQLPIELLVKKLKERYNQEHILVVEKDIDVEYNT